MVGRIIKFTIGFILILKIVGFGADPLMEGHGIGIIIGEPTGFSYKNWIKPYRAFDVGAAWSFEGEDAFHLHGDYLFHNGNIERLDEGELLVYYGLGARLKLQDKSRFGIRIPLGIVYLLESAPLDFFFELVPVMDLAPETDLHFNGGFGVRLFFK